MHLSDPYKFGPFKDLFNDSSLDLNIWTRVNGADIAITEGAGGLTFTSDLGYVGVFNQSTLTSVASFDFTGKTIDVDPTWGASGIGSGTSSGGTYIKIQDTANINNGAYIILDSGTVYYRRSNNGSNSDVTEAQPAHTTWRMVHRPSDNKWEFWNLQSGTWTLKSTSVAANWNPTSVQIVLVAYIYGGTGTNRVSTFTNLITDVAT